MFGNFRGPFEEDPFFSMHRERLRGADEIFSSFFSNDPFLALTDGSTNPRSTSRRGDRANDRDFDRSMNLMVPQNPFSSVNVMMNNMHSMMGNMSQQMNEMQNDSNGHMYTQSSVMTYSNNGNGQPKIYQATTATRQMPGGLKETRKAVRDSEAFLEKMAVGRHINDRGNVITRQKNTQTGEMDENRDYYNMGEEEDETFENEWQEKSQKYYNNLNSGAGYHRRALHNSRHRHRDAPAIESAPRDSQHHRSSRHK